MSPSSGAETRRAPGIRRASLAVVLASSLAWGCEPAGVGADGRSLTTAQPEAAGENCPAGGQRILTGLDANGDGQLSEAEVQQVAYVCNRQSPATCTTLEGDISIRNAFDWANLVRAGCTRITGTLEIAAPGVVDLGPPSPLVEVSRLEVVGNDTLTALRFPALRAVTDGAVLSDLAALTELQLPALAAVGSGGLSVTRAPRLTAIDLPSLTAVEGALGLYENPQVARLDLEALTRSGTITLSDTRCPAILLPRLISAGGLTLASNERLLSVDLPVLGEAVDLLVSDDPALEWIAAPALVALASVEIARNAALTDVALPALAEASGGVWLFDLPALARLALPALRQAGFVMLDDAPALATLDLTSLADAWYVTVRFTLPPEGGGDAAPPPILDAIQLPALAAVTGSLTITGAAGLGSLTLPALASVGALAIDANEALAGLSLPLLTSVGSRLSITGNPLLPQCQVEAVVARLQPPLPAEIAVAGNGAATTCP